MSEIETNHFKRGLAGFLVFLLILGIISGCSTSQKGENLNELETDVLDDVETEEFKEPEQTEERIEEEVEVDVQGANPSDVITDTTVSVNTEEDPPQDESIPVIEEEIEEEPPVEEGPNDEAIMLAKLVYGESRGIYSITEQACVIWTVLNRVDAGLTGNTIYAVVTSPNQFYYSYYFPTVDDYGRDLIALAQDVLDRWYREKAGETDVGRVLPPEYKWYGGNGRYNTFRDAYEGPCNYWNYSLPSPYEN